MFGTFNTSALLTGRSTISRCRTQSGPTGPLAGAGNTTVVVWGTACGSTATVSVSSRVLDDDEDCLLDDDDDEDDEPSSKRAALLAPETGTTM